MARDKLTEYSATASENTVCGDVNIAENSALPSDLNNYAREIMTHLKNFSDGTDAIDALDVTGAATIGGAFTSQGIDDNATSTAMTLDTSGNMLVGTTTNGTTADGTVIRASAETLMTRSNGAPLLLNRRGTDGAVIEVRNDNSAVGYITANAGGMGVYLGGTAAANHLDDYEEGTFSYSGGSGNLTSFSSDDRTYTKIGRQVTLWLRGSFSVTAANTRTFFEVDLPFNAASNTTVIAGGGLAEGPSPFDGVALGVGDSSAGQATSCFCSFMSTRTGSHNFWVTMTYNVA